MDDAIIYTLPLCEASPGVSEMWALAAGGLVVVWQ